MEVAPLRRMPSSRQNQGYYSVKNGADDDPVDFEDHLSSSLAYPPDTSTSRPHFGTAGSRKGYLTIISVFLIALLTAAMNHVVFSRIDGELTGSHTSQFWISTLKNVFPSAVVLELLVVLKCCLSQVVRYMTSCSHLNPLTYAFRLYIAFALAHIRYRL